MNNDLIEQLEMIINKCHPQGQAFEIQTCKEAITALREQDKSIEILLQKIEQKATFKNAHYEARIAEQDRRIEDLSQRNWRLESAIENATEHLLSVRAGDD